MDLAMLAIHSNRDTATVEGEKKYQKMTMFRDEERLNGSSELLRRLYSSGPSTLQGLRLGNAAYRRSVESASTLLAINPILLTAKEFSKLCSGDCGDDKA
jgi:hypothetical protein